MKTVVTSTGTVKCVYMYGTPNYQCVPFRGEFCCSALYDCITIYGTNNAKKKQCTLKHERRFSGRVISVVLLIENIFTNVQPYTTPI